jgi:hypothetical protein
MSSGSFGVQVDVFGIAFSSACGLEGLSTSWHGVCYDLVQVERSKTSCMQMEK